MYQFLTCKAIVEKMDIIFSEVLDPSEMDIIFEHMRQTDLSKLPFYRANMSKRIDNLVRNLAKVQRMSDMRNIYERAPFIEKVYFFDRLFNLRTMFSQMPPKKTITVPKDFGEFLETSLIHIWYEQLASQQEIP